MAALSLPPRAESSSLPFVMVGDFDVATSVNDDRPAVFAVAAGCRRGARRRCRWRCRGVRAALQAWWRTFAVAAAVIAVAVGFVVVVVGAAGGFGQHFKLGGPR